MSDSIDIPFSIGESVWRASATPVERWVTCPECDGTKAVTMTLGNGEKHSLNCACCTLGYDPPMGVVRTYDYDSTPERYICRDLELRDGAVRYGGVDAVYLYEDEEKCREHCNLLNAKHKEREEERALAVLSSKRRDMAWSVHYWRSEVHRMKKDLASVEARLAVCREKKL